jgi:hypothetical protein
LSNEASRGACETNDSADDEICLIYPFKEMIISSSLPYVNGQYTAHETVKCHELHQNRANLCTLYLTFTVE